MVTPVGMEWCTDPFAEDDEREVYGPPSPNFEQLTALWDAKWAAMSEEERAEFDREMEEESNNCTDPRYGYRDFPDERDIPFDAEAQYDLELHRRLEWERGR